MDIFIMNTYLHVQTRTHARTHTHTHAHTRTHTHTHTHTHTSLYKQHQNNHTYTDKRLYRGHTENNTDRMEIEINIIRNLHLQRRWHPFPYHLMNENACSCSICMLNVFDAFSILISYLNKTISCYSRRHKILMLLWNECCTVYEIIMIYMVQWL